MKTLKKINIIVDRLQDQDNKIIYKKVGSREDLFVEVMTDTSYYASKSSISGIMVLLASKTSDRVSALEVEDYKASVSEQ